MLIVLRELQVEALAVRPGGDMTDARPESSRERSVRRAQSYEGIEDPAKPTAAVRSRPR